MIDVLVQAWARTDALFALVPDDGWHRRPIPLRHPPLFYLGHLPAFAWNQIAAGLLGQAPMDPAFDALFERGIDPVDTDDPTAASHEGWPDRSDVLAYRDRIRAALPALLAETRALDGPLAHRDRIWHLVPIAAGPVTLGADFDTVDFGWDNELGAVRVDVPAFEQDSHPVTQARWRDFLEALDRDPTLVPRAWSPDGEGDWSWTHLGRRWPLDTVAALPVHVSQVQAQRFCERLGRRLPPRRSCSARRSRPRQVLSDQHPGAKAPRPRIGGPSPSRPGGPARSAATRPAPARGARTSWSATAGSGRRRPSRPCPASPPGPGPTPSTRRTSSTGCTRWCSAAPGPPTPGCCAGACATGTWLTTPMPSRRFAPRLEPRVAAGDVGTCGHRSTSRSTVPWSA